MMRQSYEFREISKIVWIPSAQNPANGMTKQNSSKALMHLLLTHKVSLDPKTWNEQKFWKNQKARNSQGRQETLRSA